MERRSLLSDWKRTGLPEEESWYHAEEMKVSVAGQARVGEGEAWREGGV